ncbi:MAG TPA: DoxX family protein [Anaeromyxobacteraceae bacterium]|nr:DoxX family protein [Anaeromyxobacteraceae bacterium]
MEHWLGRNREAIYALFRFVIGFLFACHGAQKLFGAFGGIPVPLAGLVLAAGIIEFVGGVLVAVGLLTSWAAFICSGQMAVAYFMAHAPGGFWPIVNKGEPAVIYCFTFLYIAARGTGAYGLDALVRRQPAQA